MKVLTTISDLRGRLDAARSDGASVGLVPTMGYLHAGHISLMTRSVTESDVTVATIFVNPLQFGAGEDLASYPTDIDRDRAMAAAAGVDLLFVPALDEMYREPMLTTVSVAGIAAPLEGASRPTHFAGVATVVAKLFAIAGRCRAYFGEKDFQQLAVIRRMARDLSFPVEVIGCPTQREADGLAMSSRNAYLTTDERAAAPVLHRAIEAGAAAITAGEADAAAVKTTMLAVLATEPLVAVDYAEVVDPETFHAVDAVHGQVRLLVAAKLGRARLIDNCGATGSTSTTSTGAHR